MVETASALSRTRGDDTERLCPVCFRQMIRYDTRQGGRWACEYCKHKDDFR